MVDVDVETSGTPLKSPTRIVGIGASAGGLEALEQFFDNIHPHTGMAFVVVQHLSPDFRSMMDELLARHTRLPIRLVQDGMPVEADHVYLIPSGKEMIISGGRLLLSERDKQQELSLPIDVFFRSLAQDCGPRAVAIVLSGGGSDGSRGVRAVHEAGGLVIVQDMQSAQFDGMPRTARDAGVARWILAPSEMPRVLMDHLKNQVPGTNGGTKHAGDPFGALYEMLEQEFGIDFTHYKPSTVTRRIERRLALSRVDDVEKYATRLRLERDELDVLYRDLLIGVTRFFRNEEAFQLLEGEILPEMLSRGPREVPFRAWVAGCATGEEAYSIAIAIQEAIAKVGPRPVKIFATDVHSGSLDRAARGVYDEGALANVPPERIDRYFQRVDQGFRPLPELRQMIVFARHNVIRDAPFTRQDLVSCRNLLIYLRPAAQQKALSLFHFALNRGGVLLLGPSETPGQLSQDYEPIDKHWRFFRKFSDVRVPVEARLKPSRLELPRTAGLVSATGSLGGYTLSSLVGTYDSLLDEFMPPSLLLTDKGQLVHAFAGASRFLTIRDGRQGLDVMDLAEDELKLVLVGGIPRALTEGNVVAFPRVELGAGSERASYRVTLRKHVTRPQGSSPHVLVTFERLEGDPSRARPVETELQLEQVSRGRLAAVEAELRSTKENLQAAIEQLEGSNEELQASNEELLASNEELQSTNEELQSVNEELYTVNAEHQRKITELVELTNDVNNLLSSTDIGTIFLDKELRIRKFTSQIAQAFRLLPQDVGRPIETFAHSMHPGLLEDLRRCLASGDRVERELTDVHGHPWFLRILPYRAKGLVDGVVLTVIDVSGLKAAEDALFRERHLLESLLRNVPDAVYFKDARGRFIRANPAMATRMNLDDPRAAVGRSADEIGVERAIVASAADEAVLRTGKAQEYVLEKRVAADGSPAWDLATRFPIHDQAGRIVGTVGILRDVTREKLSEEKIQEAVQRRDQFLAMLSHELRNPLGAIVTAARLLKMGAQGPERFIETLERQSGQMARLLDDLLEASRVTQNKIELRKQSCDLRDVAREAVEAIRGTMEARGVDLTTDLDPAPVVVFGDPARLQQIQVNLLNNAAKYTARGGHVHLRVAEEGQQAIVRVSDDGAGIPKEMLEAIFELFVQSSRTLDRSDGGLGVGLTLVRSLVAMHGGAVAATSGGLGKGSEFTVRIPLAKPVSRPVLRAVGRVERKRSTPMDVVIVEDNDDSRQLLSLYLEEAGFRCTTAATGPEGLQLIAESCPDVAIVDIGLPDMNGLEVARRLREDPKHAALLLIALTGYGQSADWAATREAGFDGHLVKPIDPSLLVAAILAQDDAEAQAASAE